MLVKSLLVSVLVSLFSFGFSQEKSAAIAKKDGFWGMIDASGNWVIPNQYTSIQNFNEAGLAKAKKGEFWGMIDKKGDWVIQPKFDRLKDFEEGYAMAEMDGDWVVIDAQGEVVLRQGDYKRIDFLHNGIILAYEKKAMKYINVATGQVIQTPEESKKLFPFSENLARFRTQEEKWGFVDTKGAFKIEPQFEDVNNFKDGKVKVKKDGLWGVIDTEGKWIIPAEFESIHNFSLQFRNGEPDLSKDETALAKQKGLWGIIDETGKWIVPAEYQKLKPLNNGIALATKNDVQGWVKDDGSWLSAPAGTEKCWSFFDDYAMIRKGGLMGFVNTKGEVVVEPKYEKAQDWSGPFGRVLLKDQWCYVDGSGKEYPITNGTKLFAFYDGLACVRINREFGYIDETGEVVIPATYTNVEDDFLNNKMGNAGLNMLKKSAWEVPNRVRNTFIIVRQLDKFGTIDRKGNVIIPVELEDLKAFYPF